MNAGAAYRMLTQRLVHTGQHYDNHMSEVFFTDLALPRPDYFLGVGGGSHAEQTARVMTALEPILLRERPDWVIVVGDVNSTLAATLTAAKLNLQVAHVEAGLRSFDRTMPEELNRIVTDSLADLLLTPSSDADLNLLREGRGQEQIRCVGNVMIDVLDRSLDAARRRAVPARLGLAQHGYGVLTLHRPANVDAPDELARLLEKLFRCTEDLPLVFPVHPRTRASLTKMPLKMPSRVHLVEPLGYLDFLGLIDAALLVLTDSGGVQEETTVLGVPCLTLRDSTERPVTLELGTNCLVGSDAMALAAALDEVRAGRWPRGRRPPLWDGHAGERVIGALFDAQAGRLILPLSASAAHAGSGV